MKEGLPVVLNIYHISEDSILNKFGISIYHTAIEYDNIEYAFGFLNKANLSGVYDIKPMTFDDGRFVESIRLGTATRRQFFNKLENLKKLYLGNSYNLLTKNCNHFTNDFSKILFSTEIPKKYTIFLKFGEFLRKIF